MIDEDNITKGERATLLLSGHRIIILIIATIGIAILFASIGLALYHVSGTAQLDLSRPSYKGVGELVEQQRGVLSEYPAAGPIDEDALREFDQLYSEQVDKLLQIDAFGADPLALDALGLE